MKREKKHNHKERCTLFLSDCIRVHADVCLLQNHSISFLHKLSLHGSNYINQASH